MSKANRQKAGVKSASSHLAAQLVSNNGAMATFDAFSGGCTSMVETEDTVSLKKLAKRDSSTREKALRELLERCTEDNVDTVVLTFSNFAAQFDKIIFDCSPIVRQLAVKLISKQVHVLKKKAEKDLFNILPCIAFSCNDPFTPCSTEATNFLNGVFSKEKWEEIRKKISEKVLRMIEEILVSGESAHLCPSKLMRNDQEDSREERVNRLTEQSYGVLVTFLKGDSSEKAEQILVHRLKNLKKNEMTRGLLNAVSHCSDAVSIIRSCGLLDGLISVLSSSQQSPLLAISIDLLLLLIAPPSTLNENERRRVVNALLSFIKKCTICDWDSLGIRLLPLFSSLCSLVEESSRCSFISNWFSSLQSNGIPSKECILYIGDCIKYVLALLDSPSSEEISNALSMMFFLVSHSSSDDPSTIQSLIIWSIPRLNPSKIRFFLEEILRRCKEKLPYSRPLLHSLLSLHSDDLLFGWEYLHNSGFDQLPFHLLLDAPDAYLVDVSEGMDVIGMIEERGDASLATVYIRLATLLPSSSFDRKTAIVFSPLISCVLSQMDDQSVERLVGHITCETRLKCVEEWILKQDTPSIIRICRLVRDEEKREIENNLLSSNSPPSFLATIAASPVLSSDFSREVAVRVVKGYVSQSLRETKVVIVCDNSRSILRLLDVPSTLKIITDQVMKSSNPLKVSSFHSMATLFYDLIDIGLNMLEDTSLFPHITCIISSFAQELSHYSLLSHYWPSSLDSIPYGPSSSSNIVKQMESLNKTLALFLALYVHRSSETPSGNLLIPIILFSSTIRLARSFPLSLLPQSDTERELLSYSHEMIESGGELIGVSQIMSLLSYSSTISRPLVIHSLRPLTEWMKNGSLAVDVNTPFSSLPTQGMILHLEMARQLYYSRNIERALHTISSHFQSNDSSSLHMFTVQCDESTFSLCMSALTGANEYMRRERREGEGETTLSDETLDFLSCGIVTALNSVQSDCRTDSQWEEGKRRLLGAAAIQLAIALNERRTEEWLDFFLPCITPIVLSIYTEIDMVDGSALSRVVNLFLATHPCLEWNEEWCNQWNKKNVRYDMEMEQAAIPSAIQTVVVKASSVLEEANEEHGEAIIAASTIIAMCAVYTISFSSLEEEKGVTVRIPPFIKNLANKDGWSRCAVLSACLSLVSSSNKEGEDKIERSVLCDAMAPVISKSLTTLISKAEVESDAIPSRYFTHKAVPSTGYFLHWLSYLLRDICSSFPSIVKMWYTALPRTASTLVNRFISSQLSSILIEHEISQVMMGDLSEKHKNDQATLTIRRHANEILMDYILEDTRMRMCIKMPIDWPLLPPSVSVEGSIVGEGDGRKWMLQLNSQLHRNASVVSALSAWLIHAGRKVEGAESCTICMMLVAPQTKQLPKARCRTCHNKFHSSCLYKWFESSNQSSCPLCRTDFTAPP